MSPVELQASVSLCLGVTLDFLSELCVCVSERGSEREGAGVGGRGGGGSTQKCIFFSV